MCLRNHLNPVLETKREALLAEEVDSYDNLIKIYKKSVLNTKNVHSSFLFTTENGYSILKCICCLVSSVPANHYNTSWLDLAAKLGYNDAEIKVSSKNTVLIYTKWFKTNVCEGICLEWETEQKVPHHALLACLLAFSYLAAKEDS